MLGRRGSRYNQCLGLVTEALATRRMDPQVRVPWSGFDLIKAFNAWKKTEEAGRRVFVVAPDGTIIKQVTGLGWRHEVSAQVFEEAAVDLGRALSAYTEAKAGVCKGRRVGFPRRKRKGPLPRQLPAPQQVGQRCEHLAIRVGEGHPRSVTLPTIGTVRVHDDTRRLRRLLRPIEENEPDTGQPEDDAVGQGAVRHRQPSRFPLVCEPQRPSPRRSTSSDATRPALPTIRAGSSGWTAAWPRSQWRPPRTGPRSAASRQPSRCSMAWWACGDGPAPSLARQPRSRNQGQGDPAAVPPARPDRRRPPQLPPCGLQPARQDPRPALPGRPRRRQPHAATGTWPAPSATPPGPSSPASSATRRPGSGPSWSSVTAGFHQPRPALRCGTGQATDGVGRAGVLLWRLWAGHRQGPQRRRQPRRLGRGRHYGGSPSPGPPSGRPGQPTPLEGKALAIALAMAEPAPVEGGTDAHAVLA